MTIHLSLRNRLPLLRQAYLDGKLGFQSPEALSNGQCRYRYPGTDAKCGIGAMIEDHEYDERFDPSIASNGQEYSDGNGATDLWHLIKRGEIEIDDFDELVMAVGLQRAHDDIVTADPKGREACIGIFIEKMNEAFEYYGLERVS